MPSAKDAKEGLVKSIKDLCGLGVMAVNYKDIFEKQHWYRLYVRCNLSVG